MNQILFTPPEIIDTHDPVIFLAGPIQGTDDWQDKAINIIKNNSTINIANPRRKYLDGEFDYNKQVDWETFYLRKAGFNGIVLFWLAKETEHDPKRAYAQTTRFELAEWKVRHERDGVKMVIGIEEGFTGARYIQRRFSQDCPNVIFCNSLEETCNTAINLI